MVIQGDSISGCQFLPSGRNRQIPIFDVHMVFIITFYRPFFIDGCHLPYSFSFFSGRKPFVLFFFYFLSQHIREILFFVKTGQKDSIFVETVNFIITE